MASVRILMISSFCLVLAGCGSWEVVARPGTARWVDASSSPSAGPDDYVRALYQALLDVSDLERLGLDPPQRESASEEDDDPYRPCNARLDSDSDRRYNVWISYDLEKVYIEHNAFSYWDVDAAEAVADLKRAARRCATYQEYIEGDKVRYLVFPAILLPDLPGIDAAYGYCEQAEDKEYTWWYCHVALARGKVLSMLSVNLATERPTRRMLSRLTPVVAKLLVKATSGS